MDDIISRRAAIDALKRDEALVRAFGYQHAIDAVQALPSAQPEHLVKESGNLVNGLVNDCISRQAAIEHLKKRLYETALNNVTEHPYYEEMADNMVSVWLKEVPSAQPEQIARDIATIIENEQDMRVILKNADHTETHSCDYQRTVTHEWIPVTERLPKNGHYYLKCTKYGNVDVDYYWDGFENATKYGEEIVAWMEKPKPYKGEQNEGDRR